MKDTNQKNRMSDQKRQNKTRSKGPSYKKMNQLFFPCSFHMSKCHFQTVNKYLNPWVRKFFLYFVFTFNVRPYSIRLQPYFFRQIEGKPAFCELLLNTRILSMNQQCNIVVFEINHYKHDTT